MVDTLVLGTSANAWEFESLHAQTLKGRFMASFFVDDSNCMLLLLVVTYESFALKGILPRTARVARLRCKRVSSCPNLKRHLLGVFFVVLITLAIYL